MNLEGTDKLWLAVADPGFTAGARKGEGLGDNIRFGQMFRKLHEIEKKNCGLWRMGGGLGRPINPPMVRENWIISRQYVLASNRFLMVKFPKKKTPKKKKHQKKNPTKDKTKANKEMC